MDLDAPITLPAEFLRKHVRRPPVEAPLHDLPRGLERGGQLTRIARMGQVVFPALAGRVAKRRAFGSRLLEDGAQPVDTHAGEVRRGRPDRPEAGSGLQPELLAS